MKPVQALLMAVLLVSLGVYFSAFRSVLRDRCIAVLLFTLSAVAIAFPDLTTLAANRLGVGRGADLITYLFVCLGAFVLLILYSKIERLHRGQTALVRELALRNPRRGAVPSPTKP